MNQTNGLICAYLLDGNGGAKQIDWEGIRAWKPDDGLLWVHLNRKADESIEWIENESGLPELVCEALLTEETRPRINSMNEGTLVNLRGVNLNPGAEPDDMISIRCWFDWNRIITLRYPKLRAVQAIRDELEVGNGPNNQGDYLIALMDKLVDNIAPVIDQIEDQIAEYDEEINKDPRPTLRQELGDLQNHAITLRRFIAPQRDIAHQLIKVPQAWLDNDHRRVMFEIQDQLIKFVEDLDAARDRANVIRDELNYLNDRRMNYTIYILSLVTAIFLPLTFLTGLLGINVGGIPLADSPYGFIVVCGVVLVLAILQLWIVLRLKWF